jgi:hypothetical protein
MKSYPEIPYHAELFQHNYGYEKPLKIHSWQWSTTFGKWGALVTFEDGWHGYTYPKLWGLPETDNTNMYGYELYDMLTGELLCREEMTPKQAYNNNEYMAKANLIWVKVD